MKRKEQEEEFFSRFTKQRRRHDDMLNSFESDLQANGSDSVDFKRPNKIL